MILVTGCGPLAAQLVSELSKEREVKSICDKEALDIVKGQLKYDIMSSADVAGVVQGVSPDTVILAEEVANLDYCEKNRMDAMYYNTRLVRYIVEAVGSKAKMVYISSAAVFDGRKPGGMYTDKDKVNPLNVYAETKVMGEVNVDKSPGYLIIRVGELYGDYVDNFVSYVQSALKYGEKLELATDMYFSPVYMDDAVKAIALLATKGMNGIYHVAGPDRISHYDLGVKIAEKFGLDKSLLIPKKADEMGLTIMVPRDSSLDISKTSVLINIRGVNEGLEALKNSS